MNAHRTNIDKAHDRKMGICGGRGRQQQKEQILNMGIEKLNACFKAFPEETKALLHYWIPCPPGMEEHVIHRELPDGTKMVSVTGLLNATIMSGTGLRLAYSVASGDMSREEELRSIDGYALVPDALFAPDNTAPVPDNWEPGMLVEAP